MKSKIHELTKNNIIAVSKKTILLLLLAITFGCDKDDDNNPSTNPIDQLPPATQIGANTFGCLLDGEVFVPDNLPLSTNCYYQFVDGEYYFVVGASNYDIDFKVIRLRTQKKAISQGETYDLYEWEDGNAVGNFTLNNLENYTSQSRTGKLTITKLTNQIVSGTFWFDVEDINGVIYEIREGRFDMQYTN